jgi:hypothetical protein
LAVPVNVENFVKAETARMFDGLLAMVGGVNRWFHFRGPTPLDAQTVIRMNRDTLYSSAIVDISEGATLTLPEAGGRYMTVMAVNEDHYINRVYAEPGSYDLTVEELGSPHVLLAARTFVDPNDPADIAHVKVLQDGLSIQARSDLPYSHPDYEEASLTTTRDAILTLAQGLPDTAHMFGSKADIDPVRHLLGAAAGWGGLPESEAYYYIQTELCSVGEYTMTLKDVPVEAFWSVTVYNRDGYLEPNPYDAYSINSVTAEPEDDGSVVLHFSPTGDGVTNHLYVIDGWNYALRLYRPRAAVLSKEWTPPEPEPTE